jgi:hypothetical protein
MYSRIAALLLNMSYHMYIIYIILDIILSLLFRLS